jgi:hypothetical protein
MANKLAGKVAVVTGASKGIRRGDRQTTGGGRRRGSRKLCVEQSGSRQSSE